MFTATSEYLSPRKRIPRENICQTCWIESSCTSPWVPQLQTKDVFLSVKIGLHFMDITYQDIEYVGRQELFTSKVFSFDVGKIVR